MLLQAIQKQNDWINVVSADCPSLSPPVSVIFYQSKKCLGSTDWEVYYFQIGCLVIYINTKYVKTFYHSILFCIQFYLTLLFLLSGSSLYLLLTLSLVRYCHYFIFDMQEECTWNISNNWIIKSGVYIKLIFRYIHLSYHV